MRNAHAAIRTFSGLGILALAALSTVGAQQNGIDTALAARYFHEAEAASRQAGGALWTVPLYGPMFFVDPATQEVVANQADREGKLQAKDGVFVGKLPPEMAPANTATRWAGMDWTMVVWPLPERRQPRLRLMMHECFHRIQPKLGMEARDAVNSHLDTLDGRVWLQMEWGALEHALWQGPTVDGRQAIEDALCFRNFRCSLFPDAAAKENALELNEGLAEYTGVKLSTASAEFAMVADMKLREALFEGGNFVRSFAYTSGPAYGYLLDARSPNWRQSLTPQSDLGRLLADVYEIKLPAPGRAEAMRRAQTYEGDEVIVLETAREREREEKVSAARKRFVDGPVLILKPSDKLNYTFNPHAVLAVDENSTVYEGKVQVSDAWGVLRSSEGFLAVGRNGPIVRIQVSAPADPTSRPLRGDGWTLELEPGWTVVPAPRGGDYTLLKGH